MKPKAIVAARTLQELVQPLVLTLVLAQFPTAALAATLKPFASDGCSSFPDGTFAQQELWLGCCTAHDRAYWKGGTYQERLNADFELRACVSKVGEVELAEVVQQTVAADLP